MGDRLKIFCIVLLSVMIALILTIVPLSPRFVWMRPQWVLLVVLFWLTRRPDLMGLIFAWLIGLFTDVLTGTLLGQHALLFILSGFILNRLAPQFQKMPIWQQSFFIFMLTTLNCALQFWAMKIIHIAPIEWSFWLSGITSMVCWPIICICLRRYQIDTGSLQSRYLIRH